MTWTAPEEDREKYEILNGFLPSSNNYNMLYYIQGN